jgi:phage shock protein A
MKEGRVGLEQYRALVERVTRQVKGDERRVNDLTAQIRAYLKVNDRTTAGKFALELKRAHEELKENQDQLALHETSYQNYLTKIQHATRKLNDVQTRIRRYDAELKMSAAEAEMTQLAKSFDFDVTTDFGELENIIQNKIDVNRAKVRVSSDLSREGVVDIEAEQRKEESEAEDLLQQFEVDLGLKTPETANVQQQEKTLGQTEASPAEKEEALKTVEKQLGA